MIVIIMDPHPLASAMLSMLIHRIQPRASVFTANTHRQLDLLLSKLECVDFVFTEPLFSFFNIISILMDIRQKFPNAKLIEITDKDYALGQSLNFKNLKIICHSINKKNSILKITKYLSLILNDSNINRSEIIKSENIQPFKLSKRHAQLINLLDQGYTNKKIAAQLGISEQTVKVHFFRLYRLLGTKSRLETLHIARTNGWITNIPL